MHFIDLRAQYVALQSRINSRIEHVLAHGSYIMGPEVEELESELSAYCRVEHTVTCANGTDALVLALKAMDIGPGDAVVTTPFTFFATAEAIVLAGARPIFADIDPTTFNIDPAALDSVTESLHHSGEHRVKAVMTVDLFGLPADYPSVEAICQRRGLVLIEDAAQGFGGAIGSRRACSFGDVATTSFFPAKPLGCYGDGGALFTRDGDLAQRLRSLRVHGKGSDKYDNIAIGTNSRLDTIQAAILLEKLEAFPRELEQRQVIADRYGKALTPYLACPQVPQGYSSSWAQYSVLARSGEERARIMAALSEKAVPTTIYYGKPMHLQTALANLGHRSGDFPVSEDISARIFSLPMGPYLSQEDQTRVIEAIVEASSD